MRIALCQFNPVVGDLQYNSQKILDLALEAASQEAEVIVFPELALCGYPPEDLLLQEGFLKDCAAAVKKLALDLPGDSLVLFGAPERTSDLFNSVFACKDGKVQTTYQKHYLPNYGVFDEERYFREGSKPLVIKFGEWQLGICICEDMWQPTGPHTDSAAAGADVLINLSASPYHQGKGQTRERMFSSRAGDMMTYVAFCNQVGGQDAILFDGASSIIAPDGQVIARAAQFSEEILYQDLNQLTLRSLRLRDARTRAWQEKTKPSDVTIVEIDRTQLVGSVKLPIKTLPAWLPWHQEVYSALQLGLGDYVRKNGFEKVLFGLSGGIDSAFVLALACDALGSECVEAVTMPSQHTGNETLSDAQLLADQKGVKLRTIPIKDIYQAFDDGFEGDTAGHVLEGVAAENIQARIRGTILMSLSNRFGHLVLAPGNKSELSVGYATLYGDTCGGFAPIADLWKTELYDLCEALVAERPDFLPRSIIARPPTAELAPGQRDDQELPPYPVLDPLLKEHVEMDAGREQLLASGHEEDHVDKILRLVRRAEYKRRQYPPSLKLTPKSFGKDRRMPITRGD